MRLSLIPRSGEDGSDGCKRAAIGERCPRAAALFTPSIRLRLVSTNTAARWKAVEVDVSIDSRLRLQLSRSLRWCCCVVLSEAVSRWLYVCFGLQYGKCEMLQPSWVIAERVKLLAQLHSAKAS